MFGQVVRESVRVKPLASLAALALAVVLLAPPLPAHAGEAKLYRDKANKFSASFPDDWDPVPLEPGEKDQVARFSEKNADAKGVLATDVTIFRLGTATKPVVTGKDAPGGTPGGEPGDGALPPGFDPSMFPGFARPTDLVEVVNENLKDYKHDERIDAKKGKAITSRDDIPGQLYICEVRAVESKNWEERRQGAFHLVATWSKPGENVQYGMWFRCAPERRKKFEPVFRASAASFRWFDDKAKDVTSLSVLDGMPISAAKRSEIERGLVAGWKVIVSPKKNYIVIYNTVKERNNQLAQVIAERIEMIREQVYEKQFPPKKKIEDVCIVRVCGGRAEYMAYGGPGGSAGYWSAWNEELVFYDASPARAVDDDTIAVLYHEAFHQYIFYSAGRLSPHSWFNEGHGDYYAGAKIVNGKFVIKPFEWRKGIIKNAIRMGPSPVKDDGFDRTKHGYTPLDRLVAFTQGEYYSYPNICYAQGWSLIYFLREIVPKNPKWNAKWGSILDTYFATLQGTAKKEAAAKPKGPPPGAPPPDGAKPVDPAMGEPAMGEPEGSDPSSGAPVPDDSGMGDPAMGDTPPPGGGDAPDGGFSYAPPAEFGPGGGDLAKALEDAFRGVNWKELEEAWHDSILKVN